MSIAKIGSTDTFPIDTGTLNGRSLSGALKRKTIRATLTATKTSNAPKDDIPATVLISPNNRNAATAAITMRVVTHGTFCILVLVINFGNSPALAIPKSTLLMEIMPLKAALAVAKSAATDKTTGNQEFKLEAANDNGESTFAISSGSLMLSTVKDIRR